MIRVLYFTIVMFVKKIFFWYLTDVHTFETEHFIWKPWIEVGIGLSYIKANNPVRRIPLVFPIFFFYKEKSSNRQMHFDY